MIGYDVESTQDVIIPLRELEKHALIVGATGSGKTTTAATLALKIALRGHKVLILDWYGEYSKLIHKYAITLRPENTIISLPNDIDDLVSILEEVLQLTPPQTYILQKVLEESKNVTSLKELLALIESSETEARWVIESKYALLRKLRPLTSASFISIGNPNVINSLFRDSKVVVLDLSKLRNTIVRRLSVIALLKVIEYGMSLATSNERVYIVIEEVHNVLGVGASLLERMISEIRKLGVSLILITQSPSILGYRIITNANVRIVHSLKFRDDIVLMCKSLGVNDECYNMLPRLRTGEALLDYSSLSKPLRVKVLPPKDVT